MKATFAAGCFWHVETLFRQWIKDIVLQYLLIAQNKRLCLESKKKVDQSGGFTKPIVTEIVNAIKFYKAENYHQRHFEKQGLM